LAIVYFLIAILATTTGAGAGIGGGVIIKPALDALGGYDVFVIGVLSSATVLAMAIVSTAKCVKQGTKFDMTLIMLAAGAVAGGFLGKEAFSFIRSLMSDNMLTTLQASILILLLVIVLFRKKLPDWHIKNKIAVFLIGLVLGAVSAFLGIGGGPINVAVLCMFFAMDIKKAATGSIFIILFAQMTKLITIGVTTGFGGLDYSMLCFMIPGGVLGGFLGAWFKHRLKEKHIEALFFAVVVGVILLNIYNIVRLSI
jgi:uncharacterized membrane protein YfcA